MFINFSKAGAEAATGSWRSSCVRGLTMPGEELWRRAPLALQRKADTTALVGTWNRGTVALQASSEECRGHPKETALSGYEVTWLLFKLDFEVT